MNIFIIAFAFLASLISFLLPSQKVVRRIGGIFAAVNFAAVLILVWPYLSGAQRVFDGGWWLIDSFSALMLLLVSFLYLAAALVSNRYLKHEHEEGIISDKKVKLYFSLLHLFALSMLVVLLANNTLLLWIALEMTTLSSVFLVGFYKQKSSIEAAWKYVIICSTGITLGLIGILFFSYGAGLASGGLATIFSLSALIAQAATIPAAIAKIAFVFIFVGFGVKVGLVPMYSWLPDAHSKAPSPISAFFSGILLNVALYVIIRFQVLTNAVIGNSQWTTTLFLVFGLASVLLPVFMMITQKNYKRLLAYSSIEHMGLILLALSVPPLGIIAAIIHMIGHTLAKSSLFFGAGEILIAYKTTSIDKVRNLFKNIPRTGLLFVLGILVIIGLPPTALFISEYTMFAALIKAHLGIALLVFAALSAIAFAMLRLTIMMTLPDSSAPVMPKEKWNITHVVMISEIILVVLLSFWISSPSGMNFINSIARNLI
ncbi:MAG: proton-conducting transporter membrane subunit [Candidatus Falkowbacteria bacterium]